MASADLDGDVTVSPKSYGLIHVTIDAGALTSKELIKSLFDELPEHHQLEMINQLLDEGKVTLGDFIKSRLNEVNDELSQQMGDE